MRWQCDDCVFFEVCDAASEPCPHFSPMDSDIVAVIELVVERDERDSFCNEWFVYSDDDDDEIVDNLLFFIDGEQLYHRW